MLWLWMIGSSSGRVAHLRQPTNLHFSTNWKQSRFSAMEEVRILLGIADNATWWPAILRNPPAAEAEQATIWRAMQAGGALWATDTVIDRIAWMAVREALPRIEVAQAAQARAEAAADAARAEAGTVRTQADAACAEAETIRAEADAARAEVEAAHTAVEAARTEAEAMRASTSWRITAPLRSIGARLRR